MAAGAAWLPGKHNPQAVEAPAAAAASLHIELPIEIALHLRLQGPSGQYSK